MCSITSPALIWFRNFLVGQLISLLNSLTGVWTTFLVNDDSSYPLLQSLTSYIAIFSVYAPLLFFLYYKNRNKNFSNFSFLKRPWKYAILGIVDLEANFLVIKAYEYTDIMSVQLFSCITTPFVLIFSVIILRSTFGLTNVVGTIIAIGGLVFLIVMDSTGDGQINGKSKAIGDLFCIGSSVFYALSNVLEEWFIKPNHSTPEEINEDVLQYTEAEIEQCGLADHMEPVTNETYSENTSEDVPIYIPLVENLAGMSFFGIIFATVQFFAVEWKTFAPKRSMWTGTDWTYQILFGLTMLCVYTLMPTLFLLCSACFANLSLLTANVYAIFWNAVVFKISPTFWFLITLFLITLGMIIFNITDILDFMWLRRIDRPWRKIEVDQLESIELESPTIRTFNDTDK